MTKIKTQEKLLPQIILTNSCHLSKKVLILREPIWHMVHQEHNNLWLHLAILVLVVTIESQHNGL